MLAEDVPAQQQAPAQQQQTAAPAGTPTTATAAKQQQQKEQQQRVEVKVQGVAESMVDFLLKRQQSPSSPPASTAVAGGSSPGADLDPQLRCWHPVGQPEGAVRHIAERLGQMEVCALCHVFGCGVVFGGSLSPLGGKRQQALV